MPLLPFSPEEQVEAFGETLILRLDFRAITVIEGVTEMPFPSAVDYCRSLDPPYMILNHVLWAMLREHHPEVTLDQSLAIVMDRGKDGARVGFAISALFDRCFPPVEDRKPKNRQRRRGTSASSSGSGSRSAEPTTASGGKRRARS